MKIKAQAATWYEESEGAQIFQVTFDPAVDRFQADPRDLPRFHDSIGSAVTDLVHERAYGVYQAYVSSALGALGHHNVSANDALLIGLVQTQMERDEARGELARLREIMQAFGDSLGALVTETISKEKKS